MSFLHATGFEPVTSLRKQIMSLLLSTTQPRMLFLKISLESKKSFILFNLNVYKGPNVLLFYMNIVNVQNVTKNKSIWSLESSNQNPIRYQKMVS